MSMKKLYLLGFAMAVLTAFGSVNPAAAQCTSGTPGHVVLGSGNDTYSGTSASECIDGNGGADTIYGNAGDDKIYGGSGDDTLKGNSGDDCLYGESGNDHLDGGSGNDFLNGGGGVDTLLNGGASACLIPDGPDDSNLESCSLINSQNRSAANCPATCDVGGGFTGFCSAGPPDGCICTT